MEYNPEIINPTELTTRIHQRLITKLAKAIENDQVEKAHAFMDADDIVIDELKTMTAEASIRITGVPL